MRVVCQTTAKEMAPLNLHQSLTQNVRLRLKQSHVQCRRLAPSASRGNVILETIVLSLTRKLPLRCAKITTDGGGLTAEIRLASSPVLDDFNSNNTSHASPRCAPREVTFFMGLAREGRCS